MKKRIILVLISLLIFCFSACGSDGNSNTASNMDSTSPLSQNPLYNKEYDAFSFQEGDNFEDFFMRLSQEYAGHITDFSDYFQKHQSDIEVNNRGFCDFDDYEKSLDGFYRFLYGVTYCESDNIPAEYFSAWSLFKTTIALNKSDLDGLYLLRGQELLDSASNMITSVTAGAEQVTAAMPAKKAIPVNIGDTITLDFVEIGIEDHSISDTILPVDTSRMYSYISDVENEKYFYISGTLKNTSGNSYSVEDVLVEMAFDNKYNYRGYLAASSGNDFYADTVKPLGTVKYYIYSSVPDELINSYKTCVITFGFSDSFNTSKYSITKEDCNNQYSITIEK